MISLNRGEATGTNTRVTRKRPAALASHDIMLQVQIVNDPGPHYGTWARDLDNPLMAPWQA